MKKICRYRVEKLIRDNTMARASKRGAVSIECTTLARAEHAEALREKLLEEAQEVCQATSHEELIDELADVLEVCRSMMHMAGIDPQQVETARAQRYTERGGFEKGLYCHSIDVEEGSTLDQYYTANSDRYIKIK